MRFISVIYLLLLCSGRDSLIAATSEANSSRASAAIRAVLEAQSAAWNRGDIDGYMNGYARSTSTEFVSGDTITKGWQTVRDRYKKKYDSRSKMGVLAFSEVAITPLGNEVAMVVGRWKLIRPSDRPRGFFTLLVRKTNEGWRIVHDHTSSAKS